MLYSKYMDSGPGFLQGTLIFTGVCAGSMALAFVFVALCSRDNRMRGKSYKESPEARKKRQLHRYNNRYFDQLNEAREKLKDTPVSEKELAKLRDQCFEEETPVGIIRMCYNAENKSFE